MFHVRPAPLLIGVLVLGGLVSGVATTSAADLSVRLDGVHSASGSVRVMLFDRAEGFRKEEKSLAIRQAAASPGTVAVTFEGLAPGRYAVMAYHDENGDGALDRFLGMIPTEGYGLSNNPEVTGPPAFEDSAFALPDGGGAITVTMRY
ncbi:MAG TPA: DUF2141 domain-containing protein [Azospirillum sp.]|nr:DUF2141 domain-containing protein [Azospirillum sp.]